VAFRDPEELRRLAERGELRLEPGMPRLDLDAVSRWLADPRPDRIKGRVFLEAWHRFRTLAAAINDLGHDAAEESASRTVYELLAWKDDDAFLTQATYNTLFRTGMTARVARTRSAGVRWSEAQVQQLAKVLDLGQSFFRNRLAYA
jgi:hypothetical protein